MIEVNTMQVVPKVLLMQHWNPVLYLNQYPVNL